MTALRNLWVLFKAVPSYYEQRFIGFAARLQRYAFGCPTCGQSDEVHYRDPAGGEVLGPFSCPDCS